MSIRAKFRLNSMAKREQTVTKLVKNEEGYPVHVTETVDARDLNFMAVYGDSGENKQYWEATPSGQLTLFTVNPAAWGQLEEGKEYYLDITPAE